MRIAIDIREACRRQLAGKGRWTLGCARELLRRPDVNLTLLADAPLPPELAGADSIGFRPGVGWHFSALQWLATARAVYLSPTSCIVPAFAGRKSISAVVLHDMIAFSREPHDRKAKCIERLLLSRALRRAAVVLSISDATTREALRRFPTLSPEHFATVYAGPTCEVLPRRQAPARRIVCIGTLCPRKNQLRLMRAFQMLPLDLRERTTLTLVGARGWHDEEIVRMAREVQGIEWIGYVDDTSWSSILAESSILAFPSLEEGFGLPVLDAFRQGVPVLTSGRSSMREIAGSAALLVDPLDERSICAGLHSLLTDSLLCKRLVNEGFERAEKFTWQACVERILRALKSLNTRDIMGGL